VLDTLQDLARKYRETFSIPVIVLTGSNGKTTTRELIRLVLSTKMRSYVTSGNLNNHIGVPLSLLRMPIDAEIGVIELGANHIGEIMELCKLSQPTHGLITNIGKDHLEGFGSYEGSLRANSELYHYLIANDGICFVNSDDPVLKNMSKRIADPIYYPNEGDFSVTKFIEANPFVTYFNENGDQIESQIIGAYNFENISAAVCVGKYFGVDVKVIDSVIGDFIPGNNRSEWLQKTTNSILLDAYNANPSSMEAALESFNVMKERPKMVILGDMFEMGEHTEREHREIGKLLSKYEIDRILLCGKDMRFAAEDCEGAEYFKKKELLMSYLKQEKPMNYSILIKGSRGMALEDCVELL